MRFENFDTLICGIKGADLSLMLLFLVIAGLSEPKNYEDCFTPNSYKKGVVHFRMDQNLLPYTF